VIYVHICASLSIVYQSLTAQSTCSVVTSPLTQPIPQMAEALRQSNELITAPADWAGTESNVFLREQFAHSPRYGWPKTITPCNRNQSGFVWPDERMTDLPISSSIGLVLRAFGSREAFLYAKLSPLDRIFTPQAES